MKPQQQTNHEDLALRKILEGTASHTGKDFFQALVKNLAEALGTKSAWVTEYRPEEGRLVALAFWMKDHFIDGYEFEIPGTPCEVVIRKKKLFHIPNNIIELYPNDPDLQADNAASYLGAPLLDLNGTVLGHLAVLDSRPMPEEAGNVALFKIFADRAASELRRMHAENLLRERTNQLQKEYQRKSEELQDARDMQLDMLPKAVPYYPNYQFAFSMKTASEVGGDYFDYQVADDQTITFGIGDATGHGLQASVMVTAIKLLFSEHAAKADITEFLKRASHSISLMDFRKIYMSFAIGRLMDNSLELAGAGIPPALHYHSKSKRLEKIPLKGLPLGSKTRYPYKKIIVQVEPGDLLVLMTDGLAELFNMDGEMLGYERVSELIIRAAKKPADEIINCLFTQASSWLNGSPQDDDMTFFVFKRKM